MDLDKWNAFCATFDKAVYNCAVNGSAGKLHVDFGAGNVVTVEVYRQKGDIRQLDALLKQTLDDPKASITVKENS